MPDLYQFANDHRNKLFILGILLFIILFGYLLYFLLFRESIPDFTSRKPDDPSLTGKLPETGDSSGTTSPDIPDTGQLPEYYGTTIDPVAGGGVTETKKLVSDRISGASLSRSGKEMRYYNKNDGKFYTVDKEGNINHMDDRVFHQVRNITWSKKDDIAILEYPDNAKIIYNFDTKKQVTLPSHWSDFDFSEDNKIILKSIGYDPNNRWLAVTNVDGSEVIPLEFLGNNAHKVQPAWSPNRQVAALYIEGEGFNRQTVYLVGLQGENFKSMTVDGRGFEYKWSPEGLRVLYSVYSSDSNYNPTLWIINAQGDFIGTGKKPLDLNTWAHKCAFANSEELYCAVPEVLPEGSGLFPELALEYRDNIYYINLKTNQKEMVAVPYGNFSVSQLISPDGADLYFIDQKSQQPYTIKLED
jgi:hypothetical protein